MNAIGKRRRFEHEVRELLRGAGSNGEFLGEKVDMVATKLTARIEYRLLLTIIGVQGKMPQALNL